MSEANQIHSEVSKTQIGYEAVTCRALIIIESCQQGYNWHKQLREVLISIRLLIITTPSITPESILKTSGESRYVVQTGMKCGTFRRHALKFDNPLRSFEIFT